ncbi:d-ribose pyranase rbsd/l-fucose mutarotase fucu [Trichococcus palustris]|jgi:D-ribose pyranase|uniref:D-ribose pyranase n=1 Tax=Trichococcus palustris TaxID=140314 RepID=A0A143YVQ5_9LACT|nr:D-ribose pyranase [Trichococcus palustris]CZQ98335.1 d-ribose pyranase rbsd/l-fucose mutarotase fucu [Trichococcus palustris]SFK95031.1 D-ribose pyranase [Trichococcus palustris]
MKKHGILNSEIAKVLADLGHTDQIVIGDAGLPVPDGVKKIDLSLQLHEPSFQKVLDILLKEMEVEKVILAEEIKDQNSGQFQAVKERIEGVDIEFVTHEAFKKQTGQAKAVIRTGEATPYSNIILQSGVLF